MKTIQVIAILISMLILLPVSAQVEQKKVSSRSSSYDYLQKDSKYVDVEKNLEKANKIHQKDPEGAINLVQEALISAKFESDTLGEARCYALLGKINLQNKQIALAEKNYQKSSLLYKSLNLISNYQQTKLLQAKCQLKLANYSDAKVNADTILLKSTNKEFLADAHEILGEIAYQKKEYTLAIEQFKKQEKYELQLDPKSVSNYDLGKAQANLAKTYAAQKDLVNADLKLKQSASTVKKEAAPATQMSRSLDDKIFESDMDGDSYFEIQEEAVSNYGSNSSSEKEIKLRSSIIVQDKSEEMAVQKQNLGELYLNSGNYPQALNSLEAANKSILDSKADFKFSKSTLLAKNLKLMSEALTKSGKNDEALAKYQEYVVAQDSAFAEQKRELALATNLVAQQNAIDAIEKEFELYKVDLELAKEQQLNAEQELKTHKIINYGLLFILMILVIASYFVYKNAKEKRRANQLLALKSLRSQMNPHFIFNALNSVNSFISKNDERAANKFLTDFSKLMRMVLDSSHEDLIPLNQELNIIELYLKLEQYRFRDKFDYELELDENLDKENFMIPPMLIQPFIENAVWHGLRYKETFGKLFVKISQIESEIEVIVEDDGIGREKSFELKTKNQQQTQSKGLQNTKERIKVINDLYRTNLSLEVRDLDKTTVDCGTYIRLRIPKMN